MLLIGAFSDLFRCKAPGRGGEAQADGSDDVQDAGSQCAALVEAAGGRGSVMGHGEHAHA